MNDSPLVTVVIPTYRRSHMLACALESVMLQTYENIEIIVVDDNSDEDEFDKTVTAARSISADVKVIRNYRQKGACGARNCGIECAGGEFIAFLDDDDQWLEKKIELQIDLILEKKYVGVYCDYIDVDLAFNHNRICSPGGVEMTRIDALSGECPTSTSLFLVSRELLINAGLFDETLPSFQDYDMWIRVLEYGNFGCVKTPLVKFVQHHGDRTSININRRLAGLLIFKNKWSALMGPYMDFPSFERRMITDALLANGRAYFFSDYFTSLKFCFRAIIVSRGGIRSIFWFFLALCGKRLGRLMYAFTIKARRIKTSSSNS